MLTSLFLLVTSVAGIAAITRAAPSAPAIVRIPAGFLLSVVATSLLGYGIASTLSGSTDHALQLALIVMTVLGAGVIALLRRELRPAALRLPIFDAVLAAITLVISAWLMFRRLRSTDGELVVSANTWGDMGLHIGLSRSFSVGANYQPTEYPFYAGEPIHYHLGFDFYAGMLQKGGLNVLWAFNLPAIIGFSAILLTSFALARMLFGPPASAEPAAGDDAVAGAPQPRWWRSAGVWAGLVSIVLVLTNQSLGWRRYVDVDGKGSLWRALNPSTLWDHEKYLAVGPYTQDRIAIFDTLNPYLGQTHLVITTALVLLLAYVLISELLRGDGQQPPRPALMLAAGITLGLSFWLNGVIWIAASVFFAALIGLWAIAAVRRAARASAPEERRAAARTALTGWVRSGLAFAIPALVLAIPAALALKGDSSDGGLSIHLGYLVCSSDAAGCAGDQMNPLSLHDWGAFVTYWWLNQGAAIPLLILAFILGTGRERKLIAAVTAIFVWGSIFSVGLDLGGHNHKTFNLWEILSGPFIAYAIVQLWLIGRRALRSGTLAGRVRGVLLRLVTVAAAVLLTATGIVDAMTVKNDFTVSVFGDPPTRQATDWIAGNTPPKARFLTDYDQLYTAPTMAGRIVLLGYSPWAQGAGYDVEPRKQAVSAIYAASDQQTACSGLRASGIAYVVVGPSERTSTRFTLNAALFDALTPVAAFGDGDRAVRIYRVAEIC